MEHWCVNGWTVDELCHIPKERLHLIGFRLSSQPLPLGGAPAPWEIRPDWVLRLPWEKEDVPKMGVARVWAGYEPVRALYEHWEAAGAPVIYRQARYGRVVNHLMRGLRPAPDGCRCVDCFSPGYVAELHPYARPQA